MWVPERVWEQSLTSDLVEAGIEYTMLDDFHFKNAGLSSEQLHGYYLTEDDGRVLNVFPGSERLRYLIPFAAPHETIDYLRGIAERYPERGGRLRRRRREVRHLARHQEARLRRRLAAVLLRRAGGEPRLAPDHDAGRSARSTDPLGQDLPARRQLSRNDRMGAAGRAAGGVRTAGARDGGRPALADGQAVRARRLLAELQGEVSRSQRDVRPHDDGQPAAGGHPSSRGVDGEQLDWARQALYRGQCNCGYWHGAFGGIYLPHLRNAVYNHLIAADNLLDQAEGKGDAWIEATADDYNFDARQEVRLANDQLVCLLAPARRRTDVRTGRAVDLPQPAGHARPPARGVSPQSGCRCRETRTATAPAFTIASSSSRRGSTSGCSTITMPARAWSITSTAGRERSNRCATARRPDEGDFLGSVYETRIRRNPDRIQVQLSRDGQAGGVPVKLTKGVTPEAGSSTLEIAYLLEGLPTDRPLHFGVEFNFAGLPSHADDRYFYRGDMAAAGRTAHAARSERDARSLPGRPVARHRRPPGGQPAHVVVDLPDRNGQPVGRRLRTGPPIGRRPSALVRAGRRARPLERHDGTGIGHQCGPQSHGPVDGCCRLVTRTSHICRQVSAFGGRIEVTNNACRGITNAPSRRWKAAAFHAAATVTCPLCAGYSTRLNSVPLRRLESDPCPTLTTLPITSRWPWCRCHAESKGANVEKALRRIAEAAERGANMICLQELFATRYPCQEEDHDRFWLAEPIPGATSQACNRRRPSTRS